MPKYIVVNDVHVGETDPMSRLARRANLPLCKEFEPGFGYAGSKDDLLRCTRAAGHAESNNLPAARHVAADNGDIAQVVWEAGS